MGRGVPRGYKHNWTYRGHWSERKLGRGRGWKIVFNATKGRRSRSWGSFGYGTTGAWRIKGIQYIRKTGRGRYQTKLVGKKYPLRFNVKRPRRY